MSWLIRWIVAAVSARVGAPRGGIIVCWSQSSSWDTLRRSASAAEPLTQVVEGICHRLIHLICISFRQANRTPVRPLQHVAAAPVHQTDGPVRFSHRRRPQLVPDPIPVDLPVVGAVSPGSAQLRRRGLPDHGDHRPRAVRLPDRARTGPRAGGQARGNPRSPDRPVPVRRADRDEPRRRHAGRGLQDRRRRPARHLRVRAAVPRRRSGHRRPPPAHPRRRARRHGPDHPGAPVAQLAADLERPAAGLQPRAGLPARRRPDDARDRVAADRREAPRDTWWRPGSARASGCSWPASGSGWCSPTAASAGSG